MFPFLVPWLIRPIRRLLTNCETLKLPCQNSDGDYWSLTASNDDELTKAFARIKRAGVGALVVTSDPFFDTRRRRIIEFAAQNKLPAIYQFREYAYEGGLISYGPSITDAYQQVGIYTARILKGEKPADLPVLQPIKFDFVINLKTAKALGLEHSTDVARPSRRGDRMKRREFIAALAARRFWPVVARAQQSAMPVIGILSGGSPETFATFQVPLREGLAEAGFVEGKNLAFEYQWAEGHFERLPGLAIDLVGRGPVVIVTNTLPAALAAKKATNTIPVVFVIGEDPIKWVS